MKYNIRAFILALLVNALFVGLMAYDLRSAKGQVFMELSGGQTHFQRIVKDNYWYQDKTGPYTADMTDNAFRLGIGYRSGNLAFTASWLDLGANTMKSVAVPDFIYDTCKAPCQHPWKADLSVLDTAKGPEFAVIYGRDLYVRSGLFLWNHEKTMRMAHVNKRGTKAYQRQLIDHVYTESGIMFAPFIGVGAKLGPLFADVTYYKALGSAGGFPVAKAAIVPMLGFSYSF